jgi:hypothetical protein
VLEPIYGVLATGTDINTVKGAMDKWIAQLQADAAQVPPQFRDAYNKYVQQVQNLRAGLDGSGAAAALNSVHALVGPLKAALDKICAA